MFKKQDKPENKKEEKLKPNEEESKSGFQFSKGLLIFCLIILLLIIVLSIVVANIKTT